MKAIVVIKEYSGAPLGHIVRIGEDSEIDTYRHWRFEEHWKRVSIPEGFDLEFIKAVEIGDTWEIVVDQEVKAAKNKERSKKAKGKEYAEDVYNDLKAAFGTDSVEVSTADYLTYKLMTEKPELFSSEGLVAESDAGDFVVGDALDSDQKVVDYANHFISAAEQYAVNRMKRRKQLKDELDTIEEA